MVQAIDRPLDSGSIGMPKIDGAMNKIAPPAMDRGGKGSKDDPEMLRAGKSRDQKEDEKILARIRKRMDWCIQAEADNRKAGLDDDKFYAGDQWPADVMAQRNFDKRPCLTINRLPTFVHQVTNDQRQNRPTLNFSPVGERSDVEVARMYRALVRAIERDSFAEVAYDTAFESAVRKGWGYWRVLTEFEKPDSFDQVIRIKRIRNAYTVYFDPNHQEPDGSDAKFVFVTEMVPREDFKEDWPWADPMAFTQSGIGESLKNWTSQDQIRVAEYFEIKTEKRTLLALANGHVGWKDDIEKSTLDRMEVLRETERDYPKVSWRKVTAVDVLDEKEWLGIYIPVVKVIGDEIDIEGKVKLSGIIRNAKDAQRMFNYMRTLGVELTALQPKAPWIMEEGQVEGHQQQWKMANVRSYPYLLYKSVNVGGKPAPPPQRQQFQGAPQAVLAEIQAAAQDLMATTGIRFDSTLQERMYDESGKALRELQRKGDVGSFHFFDNLMRSLRHTGEILVDLIPKVYDRKRIVTILREDDKEEQIQIDPSAPKPFAEGRNPQTNKVMKIYNPTYGRYGVTATIGPSYATQRAEASESMLAFAKALPNAAALIMDLIAKHQDWPGAEEMATRLAKAVPPQLLTPELKDVPPQVQAIMQQMDAQIKQLSQERVAMMKMITDQQADRAQRQDKIDKDFEAKLFAIVQKAETAFQQNIGAELKSLAEGVNLLRDTLANPPAEEVRH